MAYNTQNTASSSRHNSRNHRCHQQRNNTDSILVERHYIPINLYREMYGPTPLQYRNTDEYINQQQRNNNYYQYTYVPPPTSTTNSSMNSTNYNPIPNMFDYEYLFSDIYSPYFDLGVNTGTANTGSANTETANTETANTGTTNTGTANTGTTNTGTTNTGTANTGTTNTGTTNTGTDNTGTANIYSELLTNVLNRYLDRNRNTNRNINTSSTSSTSSTSTPSTGPTAQFGNRNETTTTTRPTGYVEFQLFDNLSSNPTVISSNLSNATQGTHLLTSLINTFTTLNNQRRDSQHEEEQHGLTAQEIFDTTTLHVFNEELGNEIDEDETPKCSICQEEFTTGQRLRRIEECEHYFHKNCIDTWFSSHNTCPMCRTRIRTDLN
jgi:hypothetical protein